MADRDVHTPGKHSCFIRRSLTITYLTCALLKLWGQMLQAEVQELRAEREAERQRILALEAQRDQDQRQMAEMIKFMQQIGQQQGWTIPATLLAPSPPPQRPDSTPVSITTKFYFLC